MINTKMGAFLLVGFIAGAFIASPELRAFAANTIGSADIIDESIQSIDIKNSQVKTSDLGNGAVTSLKIKDGDVKAADIGTDAIGADELTGVTKLIFAECTLPLGSSSIPAGASFATVCSVPGADTDDNAVLAHYLDSNCFALSKAGTAAISGDGVVGIGLVNACSSPATLSSMKVSVIVWDK